MPARSPAILLRDVGRRVAELRAVRGWTQEVFAERADVSVGYVRQVEGGRENLTLSSIAKLAGLLGVEAMDLLVPPVSREAQRGRPRRSTERVTAGAAEVLPAGPTILDVETILGTEDELRKTLSLASRSAGAQQGGAEWVSRACQVLAALLSEMGGREAPPVAGSTSEPATSIRRSTTGRKGSATKGR